MSTNGKKLETTTTESSTDEKLAELLKKFDKFDKSQENFAGSLKAVEKKLDNQHTELTKMIEKKVKHCLQETSKVSERVNKMDQKMADIIEQEKRRCNLIVNGIPSENNEDIQKLYATISSKLGYEKPPEAVVYRAKGADKNKRPIFIKFPTDYHKQQFFERYLKTAKTLTLEGLIGFGADKSRYFIHHDLTKTQYEINKVAQQMRKEGMLKQVKVIHGNVAVKFTADGHFQCFDSSKELEAKFKPANNTKAQ